MRITIVQGAFLPVPPLLGGAVEKVWFDMGRQFALNGHEVTHISRRYPGLPDQEEIDGVKYMRVSGFSAPKSMLLLKFLDFLFSVKVAGILPEADILVTNTFWLPILVRKIRFGRLYVHVARYPKGQLRLYGHTSRLQTVSTAISEEMKRQAPNLSAKIKVVPYPVVIPETTGKSEHASGEYRLLYAGRIHPEKGVDLILKALGMLGSEWYSRISLRVVGPWKTEEGGGGKDYQDALYSLSNKVGVKVEWVGPVFDRGELDREYRSADLFLYPSLAEKGETFGLAPLEAMAHGCPALVSSLACFQDFIDDKVNGFVFNHRTERPEQDLAESLIAILDNPERLKHAGIKALKTSEDFSLERISRLYLEDFESLLKSDG